jgi:AcrR family transcriptional regulator
MKEKIIQKATEMFLKLGFKSVTMDDIASDMCCSKKTLYKYFANKELLIDQATTAVHNEMHQKICSIVNQNLNAIAENFEVRNMFNDMFKSTDSSPLYQLKKHYPDIYRTVVQREIEECKRIFSINITQGIEQGLYRKETSLDSSVLFYYSLIFSINENTPSEKETQRLELQALEYHTRAIATEKGIEELEKQLRNTNK